MRVLLMALCLAVAHPAYAQTVSDNAEMTQIFDADQKMREGDLSKIDAQTARKADAERRAATRKLLDTGHLTTGTDFWHAAFVFQHGNQSADYLLAHSLAVAAAANGRADAAWIAAATLDRYLNSINQPQVYGTQFYWQNDGPVSQEPYDKAIVSDQVRAIMGVPPLAAQDVRRQEIEKSRAK